MSVGVEMVVYGERDIFTKAHWRVNDVGLSLWRH